MDQEPYVGRSQHSFAKRKREQAKAEKRRKKEERRVQRKAEKDGGVAQHDQWGNLIEPEPSAAEEGDEAGDDEEKDAAD
jgi:hypothetical protein